MGKEKEILVTAEATTVEPFAMPAIILPVDIERIKNHAKINKRNKHFKCDITLLSHAPKNHEQYLKRQKSLVPLIEFFKDSNWKIGFAVLSGWPQSFMDTSAYKWNRFLDNPMYLTKNDFITSSFIHDENGRLNYVAFQMTHEKFSNFAIEFEYAGYQNESVSGVQKIYIPAASIIQMSFHK